ncbi:MAG: SDR family NAD(P)-dependent oxidoreductase, partial [Burkholderiales bacterium]|nr:SDR family NAD(P)-dependent oxidoreductase [Burkholderiales bacterium]
HYTPAADLLADRVILVTGAGRGLGRAAALAFARHGATVVLLGRDIDRLEAVCEEIECGGGATPAAIATDLATTTARQFDAIAGSITQAHGRLDGILHSAVRLEKLMAAEMVEIDAWTETLRVNFIAPLALTRACLPLLKRAPDAAVVYTSDSHVARPTAFWAPVAAPKSALLAAMAAQADEWSQWPHLRVNVIVPGPVGSPARAFTHPGQSPASLPQPDALMPAYLYLMGPDSRGMSGRVIPAQDQP